MRPLLGSRSWGWIGVALAVSLGLATVGCAPIVPNGTGSTMDTSAATVVGGDTTTTTVLALTTTTVAPTTTVSSVHTVTTEKLASSETRLPNGHIKASGIIKQVWEAGGVRYLKIDYVDFLTGAAADAAAIADGVISLGEHVDNDYYTRNTSTKLRTFTISNTAAITTYSRVDPIDVADPPVDWATFWNFWNLIGPPLPEDADIHTGLWWIERSGNTVVKIDQLWVP
jgi:hypothetical protein